MFVYIVLKQSVLLQTLKMHTLAGRVVFLRPRRLTHLYIYYITSDRYWFIWTVFSVVFRDTYGDRRRLFHDNYVDKCK